METIVVVAHGNSDGKSWSNDRIQIITPAGELLSFDDAKKFINTGKAVFYQSSGLGLYEPLDDDDCRDLFGKIPAVKGTLEGTNFVNTGLRAGQTMTGYPVYALRNGGYSFSEIGVIAGRLNCKIILVACRARA
jgi:hypothetical protein